MKLEEYHALADEHSIQTQILNYLFYKAAPGVFAISIPNAGKRSYRVASRLRAEGMMAGVADLCVLLPSARVAWIETKTTKGRQSFAQRGFEERCKRLGHTYTVVRSLDDAVFVLKHLGALR